VRTEYPVSTDFVKVILGSSLKSSMWRTRILSLPEVSSFTDMGYRLSNDILPAEGDSAGRRFIKKIKYLRYAHNRELMEKYFIFACPGQERVEKVADVWNVPHEACFMVGPPRNIHLHNSKPDSTCQKVLYAPTYREDADEEERMIEACLDNFDNIQALMERINGTFTLRLHPHTWRSYRGRMEAKAAEYERIDIDAGGDIYEKLGSYSMIISDYSSIAFDFVLLDRPAIFHWFDLEEYLETDAGVREDIREVSPGPQVKEWSDVLAAVEEYAKNPEKDGEWRRRVRDYFYDMSVNDENNSERLTNEIKRRLAEGKKRGNK